MRRRSRTAGLLSLLAAGSPKRSWRIRYSRQVQQEQRFLFPPASSCALCQSKISDPADVRGASIAPFALWGGNMMAHTSRELFWKAKVWEEAALTPAVAVVIEDKGLRCHVPIQRYLMRGSGSGMAG